MKNQITGNLSETDLTKRLRRLEQHILNGNTPKDITLGDIQAPEYDDDDSDDSGDSGDSDTWVTEEEASQAAPVQSINGRTGNVRLNTGGGAMFSETENIERVIQWDNFFEDEESTFEGYMSNIEQSENIASSHVGMTLVFDYDQRDT